MPAGAISTRDEPQQLAARTASLGEAWHNNHHLPLPAVHGLGRFQFDSRRS
jgi:fatty-acid desaturase